ncbi:MAG: sugar nucleotide-binding protein [Thermoproteota archaeon]
MVTGASGLLGHKVVQLALDKGHEVYSLYKEHATNLGKPIKLDLTNQTQVSDTILKVRPQAIVHTAAYTDVDGCEINRDLAWKVNAEATKNLAMASTDISSHLTYVSTDYVFDGEKGIYSRPTQPHKLLRLYKAKRRRIRQRTRREMVRGKSKCNLRLEPNTKSPTFNMGRFSQGLRSIIESGIYGKVEEDSETFKEALRLHALGHRDMIDNILYAASSNLDLKLLTLDTELRRFIHKKGLKDTLISPDQIALSK